MTASQRNQGRFFRRGCTMALMAIGVWSTAAVAADPPSETDLETLESEIEELRLNKQRLDQEALALRREEEELQKKLIDAAASVQDAETRLSSVERQIIGLLVQQNTAIRQLLVQEETLSDLLAALEALEINRPPALAIEPDDAVKAARTAMLLSSLIPELQSEAQKLNDDLDRLAAIRRDIESQREAEKTASAELAQERTSLEGLLSALGEKRESKTSEAEAERRQIAALAAEARDLRTLLQNLTRQALKSVPRLKPEQTPGATGPQNALASKVALPPLQEAYANANVRKFASAKGSLKQPVSGFLHEAFGDSVETGPPSKGIRYATRAKAQVIAPFDGTIVFAGPFLGYGQLLIIEAGDGYHILLAGMDRIDGVVGQRLLAGEPVGVMGSGGVDDATSDALSLYVEFRKDGKPFNPVPWIAAREGKAKG